MSLQRVSLHIEGKKHEDNGRKKWGENPNAIATDTKTEGGGSNSNNDLSVTPDTLPEGDYSKVLVDNTMAAVILTKLEHNITSEETAEIVTVLCTNFHLED